MLLIYISIIKTIFINTMLLVDIYKTKWLYKYFYKKCLKNNIYIRKNIRLSKYLYI